VSVNASKEDDEGAGVQVAGMELFSLLGPSRTRCESDLGQIEAHEVVEHGGEDEAYVELFKLREVDDVDGRGDLMPHVVAAIREETRGGPSCERCWEVGL
jgi:hypothetical protein